MTMNGAPPGKAPTSITLATCSLLRRAVDRASKEKREMAFSSVAVRTFTATR